MNKATKNVILVILSILVIYFGYQLYLNLTLTDMEKEVRKYRYYFDNDSIEVELLGNKKRLTSHSLKISMEIPAHWEYDASYGLLTLRDPELDVDSRSLAHYKDWTKGCKIEISSITDYNKEVIPMFDNEQARIELVKEDPTSCPHCEVFNVGDIEVMKIVLTPTIYEEFEDFDGKIEYVMMSFLDARKRAVYYVESILSSQVEECHDHLEHFIRSLKFI